VADFLAWQASGKAVKMYLAMSRALNFCTGWLARNSGTVLER